MGIQAPFASKKLMLPVYKLHNLTPTEIAIVEGGANG